MATTIESLAFLTCCSVHFIRRWTKVLAKRHRKKTSAWAILVAIAAMTAGALGFLSFANPSLFAKILPHLQWFHAAKDFGAVPGPTLCMP
jgi:hypothetical protein